MYTGNLAYAKRRVIEDAKLDKPTRVEDVFQELMLPNWGYVAKVFSFCLKHDLLVIFFTLKSSDQANDVLNIIPLGNRGQPTGFQTQNYVELLEVDLQKYEVCNPICQVLPSSRLVFTACMLSERYHEESNKGADSIPEVKLLLGVFSHETEDNEDDYLSLVSSAPFSIPLGEVARCSHDGMHSINMGSQVNFIEHRGRFFSLTLLHPSKPVVLIHCWHLRRFFPVGTRLDYPGLHTVDTKRQTRLLFAINRNTCHIFAATKTTRRQQNNEFSVFVASQLKLCF